MPKMSGPFVPIPGEVFDLLKNETPMCFKVYAYMLNAFFVEEDFDVPGDWVLGRIRASKRDIAAKLGIDWSWFWQKLWPILEKLGLIRESQGIIELPKLYKKAEQYLVPAELKRQYNALREEIYELREMLNGLLANQNQSSKPGNVDNWEGKPPKLGGKTSQTGRENLPPRARESLSGSRFKKDLSLRAISDFYTSIGQKKISEKKRERGLEIYEKLREDGFTAEQIQFAVEWTVKNATEDLYDFSILEHTIGQAMTEMAKEEKRQERRERRELEAAERERREGEEEAERRRVLEYKESLGPAERKQLRSEAEQEIKESGQFKDEFIDDFILEVRENQILRRRLSANNIED